MPAPVKPSEALEVIRDFGLARLGFGDGTTTINRTDRPVTTIRMPGLSLPEPSAARDTYTRAERVSVATLSLVAAYALKLISGDRSRHKVVGLDEIWFLLASPQGRQDHQPPRASRSRVQRDPSARHAQASATSGTSRT